MLLYFLVKAECFMKSRISDEKIKDFVSRYVKGDDRCYSAIVNMLSQYIYNYPRVVFGTDLDTCSDFYEYVLSRFKNILNGYRESDAKFTTWFTIVLRNRYLNYIRAKNAKYKVEQKLDIVSFDCSNNNSQNLYNIIGDNKEYMKLNNEEYESFIDNIIKNLKDKQRIFFHLYFIETFRPEDVGFISIYLGRTVRESLTGIGEIRKSMTEKYRLKNKLFQRLNNLFYEIIKKQKEKNHQALEKLKKKRNIVLDEYKRVKLNPSYSSLSQFLGLPIGTVSTGIMRMKEDVRQFIKERYREKMSLS